MGLMDSFRPKWKHSEPEVRKLAIKELDDKEILLYIIKNEKDEEVKEIAWIQFEEYSNMAKEELKAAIKKLEDQNLLSYIARCGDNWGNRELALKNLENQNILADIAKNESDKDICELAIEKLEDQNLLADVANNTSFMNVCEMAIKKLEDQNLLADIAKGDQGYDVREQAVYKLDDQKVLADIAKNDSDEYVRKCAVEKLEDQNVLADFAKNDENKDVRKAAVKKLTDQAVIADIAKNDSHWSVCESAVKKLEDQNVLADFAKNDENKDVREAAVEKLTDQAVIADIAKNDSNEDVRKCAVKKLEDQYLLADVVKNKPDKDVCKMAVKKLDDQYLLADVAKNKPDRDIYELVFKKLEDQNVMADVAKNASNWDVREEIIKKLNNKKILADIAKNDNNAYVRLAAVGILEDQNVLAYIAENDKDISVRYFALTKLHNKKLLSDITVKEKSQLNGKEFLLNEINRLKSINTDVSIEIYPDEIENHITYVIIMPPNAKFFEYMKQKWEKNILDVFDVDDKYKNKTSEEDLVEPVIIENKYGKNYWDNFIYAGPTYLGDFNKPKLILSAVKNALITSNIFFDIEVTIPIPSETHKINMNYEEFVLAMINALKEFLKETEKIKIKKIYIFLPEDFEVSDTIVQKMLDLNSKTFNNNLVDSFDSFSVKKLFPKNEVLDKNDYEQIKNLILKLDKKDEDAENVLIDLISSIKNISVIGLLKYLIIESSKHCLVDWLFFDRIFKKMEKKYVIQSICQIITERIDHTIRSVALYQLKELKDKNVLKYLIDSIDITKEDLFHDDLAISNLQEIIEILLSIGDKNNLSVLVDLIPFSDRNTDKLMIKTLESYGWDPDNSIEGIIFLVKKKKWNKLLEIDGIEKHLVYILSNHYAHEDEIKGIIKILSQIGTSLSVDVLIERLDFTSEVELVADALGNIGDKKALEKLAETWIEYATSEMNIDVARNIRVHIIKSLSKIIGKENVIKFLEDKFSGWSSNIRNDFSESQRIM